MFSLKSDFICLFLSKFLSSEC